MKKEAYNDASPLYEIPYLLQIIIETEKVLNLIGFKFIQKLTFTKRFQSKSFSIRDKIEIPPTNWSPFSIEVTIFNIPLFRNGGIPDLSNKKFLTQNLICNGKV